MGNRSFPPTPSTEDPFVADEASLKASHVRHGATADEPAGRETEAEFEFGKRITEDLGFSIESSYTAIDNSGHFSSSSGEDSIS